MFACGSQQDLYLFPLPCATGSAVPREGVIILASLLVFPMLGCRPSLLQNCNISSFLK